MIEALGRVTLDFGGNIGLLIFVYMVRAQGLETFSVGVVIVVVRRCLRVERSCFYIHR